MTDPNADSPVDASPPPESPPPVEPVPRRRRRWPFVLAGLVLAPVALFAIYLATVLTWSYSDGMRVGILQKFSRKGWLCKTYEGEMAMTTVPGVAPALWEFTVRDESVIPQMNAALGKRVSLHYKEHRGVPTSCFGQTGYYVDSVVVVN